MPHDGAWHAVRRARPEGAEVHSPGQAKRRPGYNVPWSPRPVRAKVLKQSVLYLLLPLQGVV